MKILRAGRQLWRGGTTRHEVWNGPRTLDVPEFWFVRGGRGGMLLGGEHHDLRPGSALVLPANKSCEVLQNPSEPLNIAFFALDRATRGMADGIPPVLADYDLYEGVTRRVIELFWEAGGGGPPRGQPCPGTVRFAVGSLPGGGPLALASRLLGALLGDLSQRHATAKAAGGASKACGGRSRRIALEAAARIRSQPGGGWSVAGLARDFGYGADHFSRVFRSAIGMTPRAYALNCRMDEARRLLGGSHLSVKEIAARLGYSSVHFFSRQFTAHTGCPPSLFRTGARRAAA